MSDQITIQVYDSKGNATSLPIGHPRVTEDELIARRDNVRNVFLPEALTSKERKDYTEELNALNYELKRRTA